MGSRDQSDVPGNRYSGQGDIGTVASNAADTVYQAFYRAPVAGKITAVNVWSSASQASDATNYRSLKLINRGLLGAGTLVMASNLGTASRAADTAQALTISTTAANLAMVAGDILAFLTTKVGDGVVINVAHIQVDYQMT